MKRILEKLKKEKKTEYLLMAVFVCIWLIFFLAGSKPSSVEPSGPDGTQSGMLGEDTEMEESTEERTEAEASSEDAPEEGAEGQNSGTEDSDDASKSSEESSEEDQSESESEESAERVEELQAVREQILYDQLGDLFQIPMQTKDAIGLPVWKGSYDCGTLHFSYELELAVKQAGEQGSDEKPLSLLQDILTRQIESFDGVWSVYVKNLSTQESFVINDRPMKSASVMKLFVMGTVYTAIENGTLARTDEIMSLMSNMISLSDNSATNQLLYILGDSSYADGIALVNEFIDAHGFSDMTVEYNGFNDPATNTDSGSYNQIAAKDCGKLLEDVYRRAWVNRSVSNEIENMLLAQNTRYKIPAGLPDGVLCGNKSGEMDTAENDAAIIYSDSCDYILVVLSNDWSSKDAAIEHIRSVSAEVYEFLN